MSDFGEPSKPNMTSSTSSDEDACRWSMFLHLSQLSNFIIPIAGVVAPIVIWQIKKDEYPVVDVHGKNAVNWILSLLIYGAISTVLLFFFVGFLLLPILGVIAVVFPIIAGIKANNGEVWKYPLTFQFFK